MLNILLVEDEPLLAETTRQWIELNPLYRVTDVARDLGSALEAAEHRRPHIAIVDLQLADGRSGLKIAEKLSELGVQCLFTTGDPPTEPVSAHAVGCLVKPYTYDDLVRAIRTAEDAVRGREPVRPKPPSNLQIYSEDGGAL